MTLVYDRKEVERLLRDENLRDGRPTIRRIVEECRRLCADRPTRLEFRHKCAHQPEWVARDDFAHWNNRADELAGDKPARKDADRWFMKAGLTRVTPRADWQYRYELQDRPEPREAQPPAWNARPT